MSGFLKKKKKKKKKMGLDTKRCVDIVHNDLTCPICLDILSLDCLVDENDHIYCKICIIGWFDSGNRKCPIGNEIISLRIMKVPRIVKNLLSEYDRRLRAFFFFFFLFII